MTFRLTGPQNQAINAPNNGGTWDLTGASWNENAPDPIAYPIRSDALTKGAIVGGEVFGNVPKAWTRDQWYNGLNGGRELHGDAYRQTMTNTVANTLTIQDGYVEDYEDAYDPNAARSDSTTTLEHVRATYIRDDCIENEDVPHNLVIRNSLFDGCFTGIAERPAGLSGAQVGTGPQSLTVDDSLMYIQPQPLGPTYCTSARVTSGRCRTTSDPSVWLGAQGIWKWSTAAASTVTVRNTIFKLDMPSYSSCVSQQWPPGTYQNVTLVWAGQGPYATAGGCNNVLPSGVTLTTDVSVWDRAKAAWLDSTPPPTNSPPTVSAGPDLSVTLPASASLDGTVSDDGLPVPPGATTATWSKVSGPGTVAFGNVNAVDTTASFSAAGGYVLQLSVTDGALSALDQVAVNVAAAGGGGAPSIVEVPVRVGSDDAEERPTGGGVDLVSSDLELVTDGTTVQTVGMRFTNVTVPRGATITNAYVQFSVDETASTATGLTLAAQAVDNASTFTTAAGSISARARTAARVSWTPASWLTVGARGTEQRTPNLAPVLAEVVGRPGWASGNAMAVIVTGTGRRTADSFEGGAANAPTLHIEYASSGTPATNAAPTVDAGADLSVTLPASASLDGTVSDDGLPVPPGATTATWSKVSGPGTVAFGNVNAVDTTASFSAAGGYVLQLSVTDGALSALDQVAVNVAAAGGGGAPSIVEVPVRVGSDDAEERPTGGGVDLVSSDLELVTDGTTVQTVGMRFTNVTVPRGATITNAYVQFSVDETASTATGLTLAAQAVDNASTFTTAAGSISARARTAARVSWTRRPGSPSAPAAPSSAPRTWPRCWPRWSADPAGPAGTRWR